ncbi:hypothetical protein OROGR_008921 [Orobanche gracilis]
MNPYRGWMYSRMANGYFQLSYFKEVENFIEFATSQPRFINVGKIKCPCTAAKCKNQRFLDTESVKEHLVRNGFVPNYEVWIFHGETNLTPDEGGPSASRQEEASQNPYVNMVVDEGRRTIPDFNFNEGDNMNEEEPPNPDAKKFYDMLEAANELLWDGCEKHTKLSLVARLMSIKAENRMSKKCYDQIAELMKEIAPENNDITRNFYSSKKLLRGMGLPAEKIDCCENGCMLYWGDDLNKLCCKICDHPRYKKNRRGGNKRQKTNETYKKMYYFPLTPRLQRLYASEATADDMRWHATHESEPGVMHHPSNSEAWTHFSDTHPNFAAESRNVRLGLSADGFAPFGQYGKQYSSWPVVLTPYNLPPGMCMKKQYMFLTVLVPGPHNPKDRLDVYLQPLIAELKQLWDVGWGTAGALACPHSMEETDAFTLRCSGKQSWFDNHRKFLPPEHPFRRNKTNFKKNQTVIRRHAPIIRRGSEILREIEELGLKKVVEVGAASVNAQIYKTCGWKKRSIFWDLPYWSSNTIRHNLDVMHVEKNVFENVFNTVMDNPKKTKDTAKSRAELNDYCRRPELKQDSVTGKYPQACYTLKADAKAKLCEWIKNLKFPDGFASNLGRCVDMQKKKLFGMKSHDCHVFMQRLIPIAFRELLPQSVWTALTELSMFFKELTATVISKADMERLEKDIPVILCKLEHIFPPSFFDSMEHLPVHLPYEAKIAGPVQYRWMYPFERYLRKLKNNVKNKNKVESSIANAYLMEEASSFCSYYFEEHVGTKARNVPRNEDVDEDDREDIISLFRQSGRAFGKKKTRYLTDNEYNAARAIYYEHVRRDEPNISDAELDKKAGIKFPEWFKQYVFDPVNNVTNECIKSLAMGPFRLVTMYPAYMVGGYRFHTLGHGTNRATINSGVCIKGTNYNANEYDYYGRLSEVLVLEYSGLPLRTTVLFNVKWFDPMSRGTKRHLRYNLVDINHKRRFNGYEPFVLCTQAEQVCYCAYPSLKQDKVDWWAVFKVRPRSSVPLIELSIPPSFQEETIEVHDPLEVDYDQVNLQDPSGAVIELPYELSDSEDDFELDTDDEIEDDIEDDGSG